MAPPQFPNILGKSREEKAARTGRRPGMPPHAQNYKWGGGGGRSAQRKCSQADGVGGGRGLCSPNRFLSC